MHQFGWLSERGNFLNLLQKEGGTQKGGGGGGFLRKGRGGPTLEKTMTLSKDFPIISKIFSCRLEILRETIAY